MQLFSLYLFRFSKYWARRARGAGREINLDKIEIQGAKHEEHGARGAKLT